VGAVCALAVDSCLKEVLAAGPLGPSPATVGPMPTAASAGAVHTLGPCAGCGPCCSPAALVIGLVHEFGVDCDLVLDVSACPCASKCQTVCQRVGASVCVCVWVPACRCGGVSVHRCVWMCLHVLASACRCKAHQFVGAYACTCVSESVCRRIAAGVHLCVSV
jgi:hypothetical protein